MSDVHRRTVWSLKTGRVIDDSFPEDVADEILHRELAVPEDIRVELVMKDALCMYHRVGSDVSEVYSQPRIARESSLRGYMGQRLQPGWSLDLTRLDPLTGLPWDLSCVRVQRRVLKMVEKDQPLFLIGSPPCTVFSNLQNLSRGKQDAAVVAEELRVGRLHLEFCAKLYELQVKGGGFSRMSTRRRQRRGQNHRW